MTPFKHPSRALAEMGTIQPAIERSAKLTDWKGMIAAALKRCTSAPHGWITRELNMGVAQGVSLCVGRFKAAGHESTPTFQVLVQRITE